MANSAVFLRKFDPLRQLSELAEGGGNAQLCLTSALFWPSANYLAWRKAPRIIDDGGGLLLNHAPKFFANRDKN